MIGFAPLGVRLGPQRLVAAAERFGFNQPGAFPIVAPSSIPQGAAIGDDLAVGSTAIGQGEVNYEALLPALWQGGYRGPYTLERAVGEDDAQKAQAMAAAYAYMKGLLG